VDLAAQKILWTSEETRKEAFSTPALAEGLVLFSADDGRLYALDRATGKLAWKQDTGGAPTSPVVAGKRVVIGSSGSLHIHALEDGRRIATLAVADEITSPALSGGRIVVGADDGTVSAWGAR
jgi:outer membrane protein assembly factor BamB